MKECRQVLLGISVQKAMERKDPVRNLLILFAPGSKQVSSETTTYVTVLCVSKVMHFGVYRLEVLLMLGGNYQAMGTNGVP